jgi:hypothetical protein
MLSSPTTRELHRLREALCRPEPAPASPGMTLSEDEVCALVDALHDIEEAGKYLSYWAQLDAPEAAALARIRQTARQWLDAFAA